MRFTHIALKKDSSDSKVGVKLASNDQGVVVIKNIAPTGLFAKAAGVDARVGDRVLRIGSAAVDGMDANDAVSLIKDAPTGYLTILVMQGKNTELEAVKADSIHVATANKTAEGKIKVQFGGRQGIVKITEIFPDSPFENKKLRVGDTILSVNNISVIGMDADQICDVLQHTNSPVTLVVSQSRKGALPSKISESVAPPEIEPGGIWGTVRYIGPETQQLACIACLCCGLPGLCVLMCPSDKKDAYKVNGKVYEADGNLCVEGHSFVPKKPTMER